MLKNVPETMSFIDLIAPGPSENLTLSQGKVPRPGDDDVLIRVRAAGVNRPDIAQRLGKYPPPPDASPVLGLEVSGQIVAVGKNIKNRLGESVCALVAGGGYAQYAIAPSSHALPLPTGLSFIEAAGIPETYFTVWANLFEMGRLKAGESVLIHGGASGIGTTAIQLARAFGAQVFVTAGTEAKCEATLTIGAHHAMNYKTQQFEHEILRLTENRGVDVILDMVGGSYAQRNLRCLARDGRLVQISVQQGAEATINLAHLMQKRATLTGSTMRPRTVLEKAAIAQALHSQVWPLLETRKVKVIVNKVFKFAEAARAHQYLEAGDHFGKVILDLESA